MTPRRPTILQIVPRLDAGGAELSAIEIAAAVVAAGGRALVASEGGRMADRVTACGGEIVAFPAATKNPLRMLANVQSLARLIRSEQVDLVHARSRAPAWSAWLAARRTSRPFVTTYHGAYAERGPLKRRYNSIMARGDVVIANSAYTRDLVVSRYGTDPDRMVVIHRGIDAVEFDPERVSLARRLALRSAWQVASDTPLILHPARLTPWKGQATVISALAELRKAGVLGDAVLVVAGDAQGRDDYRAALARQVADAALDAHVRIVGHVGDMPAAFAVARVAVVASVEPEAFGRTAIEAQAMGCPIVATDIGAPPETVLAAPAVPVGAITGWLVPPADTSALAGVLRHVLNLADADRAALAARARARVLQYFSLDRMKLATLAVYDQLLGTDLTQRWRPSS